MNIYKSLMHRHYYLHLIVLLLLTVQILHFLKSDVATVSTSVQRRNELVNDDIKIAWLMAYPRSGSSLIFDLLHKVSKSGGATNYGDETLGSSNKSNVSVPLLPGLVNGPFKLIPDLPVTSRGYILTKTHCGGYCLSDCPPNWYRISGPTFLSSCAFGRKKESINGESVAVRYNPRRVGRSIHLIHDPFDNIVSRFHYEVQMNENKPDFPFSYTIEGFRAWCDATDKRWKNYEKNIWNLEYYYASIGVPCHKEIYQFVMWHNNVFEVLRAMNIPHLIVYYEDFRNNLPDTVDKIMNFLELPSIDLNYTLFQQKKT